MANKEIGQQLVKILAHWDGPFPEESRSLQQLTDLVNKIVDTLNAMAPQAQANAAQQTSLIGVNANGQPALLKIYTNGAPIPYSTTALTIPGGQLAV